MPTAVDVIVWKVGIVIRARDLKQSAVTSRFMILACLFSDELLKDFVPMIKNNWS